MKIFGERLIFLSEVKILFVRSGSKAPKSIPLGFSCSFLTDNFIMFDFDILDSKTLLGESGFYLYKTNGWPTLSSRPAI